METQQNGSEKLWLLVEETYAGRSSFTIVDSEEVIGTPTKDHMHTGKTVKIRKGKITLPATIVYISDDRDFLEHELIELTNKDENNPNRKRRRTNNDIQILSQQLIYPSHANWIPNHQTPQFTGDRILTPSSGSTQKVIQYITPPMTFDQQTQTENKNNTHDNVWGRENFVNVLTTQNHILEVQKRCLDEASENKKIVITLVEQIEILKAMVVEANMKLKKLDHIEPPTHNRLLYDSSQILNEQNISTSRVIVQNESSKQLNDDETEVIFTITEESNQSNNNSRMSFNDTNCSSASEYGNSIRHPLTPQNLNKSNISLNESTSNLANNILTEWVNKDDGDIVIDAENDLVSIGSNKTQVSGHTIRQINWNSHTAATRKLLMALFPRDTLATHSLTGKPSPGNYLFNDFTFTIKIVQG